MGRADFSKNINISNFNYLIYAFLIFAFAGVWFLGSKGVNSGLIYTMMIMGAISFFLLIFFFVANDDTIGGITDYFKVPISKVLTLAVLFYFLGTIFPILLYLLGNLVSLNATSLAIPLMGAGQLGSQTLSAIAIEESISNQLFTIGFVAGTAETFAYNLVLPFAGLIVGILVYSLLTKNPKFAGVSRKVFISVFALAFSTLAFVSSHLLNGTYVGYMFLIAGIFLLLTNILIYYGRVFLSAVMGYHIMNNMLVLLRVEGARTFFSGFFSVFGLIYVIMHVLMLWYLISRFDDVKRDWEIWRNG